ncbi:hypothetical protein MAXJ12_32889 [Mesorhizobium alhagi CCNWXJ12-2]|uniref:Uncharacterized protein n=1 Tax=Mesorhizobium alhagi CCNWXJ12-2 TaxID=1107882 RepID=H0I280_9HYPH|nr:hypothetical protein MAXJ12_32889 [Mesorhizobium alhagi CCNWXJ12-2]
MDENCAPGRINVSETVAGNVKTLFELDPRGAIDTKRGRRLEMFFLNRLKPEYFARYGGPHAKRKICRRIHRLLSGFPG